MIYMGFDIGGTKCAVSLGRCEDGVAEILGRTSFPTPQNWERALEVMAASGEALEGEHGVKAEASGMSCGNPLDAGRGLILSPPNLPGWDEVPATEWLRKRLSIPSFLENDANACALAEWRWGAGRGARSMVFLTCGTGMGAGLILDGRLYRGANGYAGEVGHTRLAPFGPSGYGKPGSFEGFCSGGGIAQLAVTTAHSYIQRGITPEYMASGEPPSARSVAEAAQNGDAAAIEVYSTCGEMLGRGLSLIIDILNPEVVVIGSIYARSGELMRDEMSKVISAECLPYTANAVSILPAELGDSVGDYAALCVAEYGMSRLREQHSS